METLGVLTTKYSSLKTSANEVASFNYDTTQRGFDDINHKVGLII